MPKYAHELANYFNHNLQRWEYRIYKGDLVTWVSDTTWKRKAMGVVLSIDKKAEWCTVQWNTGSPPKLYGTQYRRLLLVEDIEEYNTIRKKYGKVIANGIQI
tara:strand:+ start:383 stop:688 length:306 start_codon:yes stop_codon:yes gene_type:complete